MSLEGMLHSNQEIRGRISGMSVIHTDAYEIALRNGFEGTVEEWLASLKGEKGDSSVGADWNAAEGEPGHIKNRTHWDDCEEVAFVEDKTVNKTGYTTVSWLTYDKVKDCTTARVIFNGVEYVCPVTVKINFTEYGDESYFYIGNFQDGAPQYPFCFWGYIGNYFAIVNAEDGTHTVSIYGRKEVVHKLPEKYLPDYIKTVNGIAPDENGNVEVAGITYAEKNIILSLFRNAVYTSADMGNVLAQLETLWSGGEVEPDVPNVPDHTHNYTSAVTTAATCETAGVRAYTCSCGHSYTEAIQATGHNYVDGVCTVCGAADPDYEEEVTAVNLMTTGELEIFSDLGAYTGYTGYYDADDKTLQLTARSESTNKNAHFKITPFVEAGKTYTLFADVVNRANNGIKVDYSTTASFATNNLSNVKDKSYVQFTVPDDAVTVYLQYTTTTHQDTIVTNVALYEGALSERP